MPSLSRSRWILAGVLAGLSVLAIAATWSRQTTDAEDSYVPRIGADIRKPVLMFGSAGLGGLMLMRSASVFLPKPWRVYIDRLEFSFVSMLWILWTSATMAFSASTISKTICTPESSALPSCSILPFDLSLLHLLSVACFAYLVVVLSTALSPGYYTSLSTSLQVSNGERYEDLGDEGGDVFVMWELALGESPKKGQTALPEEGRRAESTSYGTTTRENPVLRQTTDTVDSPTAVQSDRFARGRVGLYVPLIITSLATFSAICALSASGYPGLSAILVLALSVSTAVFLGSFLVLHHQQRRVQHNTAAVHSLSRKYKAVELGGILALFILWPVAATLFTLNPASNARPCTSQPSIASFVTLLDVGKHEDDEDESLKQWLTTCNLALLTLAMSWTSAWLALARAVILVFPMPETLSGKSDIPIINGTTGYPQYPTASGEGRPLLGGPGPIQGTVEGERPQVKWGRIVAGEAFELGDDED